MQKNKKRIKRGLDVLGLDAALLLVGGGLALLLIGVGVDVAMVRWLAVLYAAAVVGATIAAVISVSQVVALRWELPNIRLPRPRRPRRSRPTTRKVPKDHPRALAIRLWLRDHGRWFLLLIPLGLAVFLTAHFWPWGLVPAVVLLLVVGVSIASARQTRADLGEIFLGRTIIRNESYHWLGFLVYIWEWGKGILAPLWPLLYLTVSGLVLGVLRLLWMVAMGPSMTVLGDWKVLAGWAAGLVLSTIYWWWFSIVVWHGYQAVITDGTIGMVYPVPGVLGTVDVVAAEVPLAQITKWETRKRAIGGGSWDPGVIFGGEPINFPWLRHPAATSLAAQEQLARLIAERQKR